MDHTSALKALSAIYARVPAKHYASVLARGEVERLQTGLEKLVALHHAKRPSDTPDAHFLKTTQAAEKLAGEFAAINDRLQGHIRSGLKGIDAAIVERVGLIPNEFAAEFRSIFRSLDQEGRVALLNELVDTADHAMLAAIVSAPAALVGIPQSMQERFRQAAIEKSAPDLIEAQSELLTALDAGLTAYATARDAVGSFSDPVQLKRIMAQEADAVAAQAGFEAAITKS